MPGAHRAGLQRDIQGALIEEFPAEVLAGRAKACISAWAVKSRNRSYRLWARAMIRPPATMTAPTGTSPSSAASFARSRACSCSPRRSWGGGIHRGRWKQPTAHEVRRDCKFVEIGWPSCSRACRPRRWSARWPAAPVPEPGGIPVRAGQGGHEGGVRPRTARSIRCCTPTDKRCAWLSERPVGKLVVIGVVEGEDADSALATAGLARQDEGRPAIVKIGSSGLPQALTVEVRAH